MGWFPSARLPVVSTCVRPKLGLALDLRLDHLRGQGHLLRAARGVVLNIERGFLRSVDGCRGNEGYSDLAALLSLERFRAEVDGNKLARASRFDNRKDVPVAEIVEPR